jgi:putative acyl-CoA dehydrogenase
MELAIEHGVTGFGWRHAEREGAHVARAALMYLHNQADQGTSCPLTMTYACVPSLDHQPELGRDWLARVVFARTSEPPCFSVIPMPIVLPRLCHAGIERMS